MAAGEHEWHEARRGLGWDPHETVLRTSVAGHHVAGTSTEWEHGWDPLTATAAHAKFHGRVPAGWAPKHGPGPGLGGHGQLPGGRTTETHLTGGLGVGSTFEVTAKGRPSLDNQHERFTVTGEHGGDLTVHHEWTGAGGVWRQGRERPLDYFSDAHPDSGMRAAHAALHPLQEQAQAVHRAKTTAAERKLRSIYGDRLSSDGSPLAGQHIRDLADIPAPFHRALASRGTKVSVGNGALPDLAPGVESRYGLSSTATDQRRWADIAGAYLPQDKHVVIGNTARHGSANIATHETAHALDRELGGHAGTVGERIAVSDSGAFREAYAQMMTHQWAKRISPYYRDPGKSEEANRRETFAEGLTAWLAVRGQDPEARQEAIALALSGGATNWLGDGVAKMDAVFSRLAAAKASHPT